MTKTYGELMTEIVASPYSKDMFNLHKECAELSVMEEYLESQMYIRENFNESVNIDSLMEAADDNRLNKVLSSAQNLVGSIASKGWKLILRLLDLISRAATVVVNWVKSKFNKESLKNSVNSLGEALKETNKVTGESATFTEAENKTNNEQPKSPKTKVFSAFVDEYRKATSKFDDKIFVKHSNENLKRIFKNMKIYFTSNLDTDRESNRISLNEFYDKSENTDMKEKAKQFIEIANTGCSKIIFEFPEASEFPVMDINDYCDSLYKAKGRFTLIPNLLDGFGKGLLITYAGLPFLKLLGTSISYAFSLPGLLKLGSILNPAAMILSIVFLMSLYENKVLGGLFKKDPVYDKIFKVDLEKSGNSLQRSVLDNKNAFNKVFTDVVDIIAKYSKENKEAIAKDNESNAVKVINFASGYNKDKNGNKTNEKWTRTKKIMETIAKKWAVKWRSLLHINRSLVGDNYQSKTILSSYSVYIKRYYEVGANMMTLLDASSRIANIVLDIANGINKAANKSK